MTIHLEPHLVLVKPKGILDHYYFGPFHSKKEAEDWIIMKTRNDEEFDKIEIIPLKNPFEEAA